MIHLNALPSCHLADATDGRQCPKTGPICSIGMHENGLEWHGIGNYFVSSRRGNMNARSIGYALRLKTSVHDCVSDDSQSRSGVCDRHPLLHLCLNADLFGLRSHRQVHVLDPMLFLRHTRPTRSLRSCAPMSFPTTGGRRIAMTRLILFAFFPLPSVHLVARKTRFSCAYERVFSRLWLHLSA